MAISKGFQFGRYAEVEIRNYVTGEKTIIPDAFEIDFSFLKSVDEVDNSSVGQIKIYGLTPETYRKIYSKGGEVELRCGYTNSEVKTLFIADILTMSQIGGNSTTETTITCSANVLSHIYGGYLSIGIREKSLMEFFDEISKQTNINIEVNADAVPKELQSQYIEYMTTASFSMDFAGSPREYMGALCDSLGMTVTHKPNKNGRATNILTHTTGGLAEVMNHVNNGYSKVDRSSEAYKKVKLDEKEFKSIFITPEDNDSEALVLNKDSGLRSVSMEFKIATALETQELASNEDETQKSIDKRNERDRKLAEKKQKALDAGKTIKPKKPKINTIKVNRKSLRIVANINPSARPQMNIKVESDNIDYNGIFISRQIEFSGNNKQGAWDMNIIAEDTLGRYDTKSYDQTIEDTESNEEDSEKQFIPLNGELGKDTSYGANE